MKDLKDFICEGVNSTIVNAVTDVVKGLASKLNVSDAFTSQDENAALICDKLRENEVFKYCRVMTLEDYYDVHGSKFRSRTDCDLHKGDIIIFDKDGNEYCFDLKVSEKYLGAISMNSVINFDKDGYYVLVNVSSGKVKIIEHQKVVNNIINGTLELHTQTNRKRSVPVKLDGKKYMSEDFVSGKDLENL